MKLYFPIHLNGDNRGCEAIAKGTIEVLKCQKDEYVGYCSDIILDRNLNLDNNIKLIEVYSFGLISRAC